MDYYLEDLKLDKIYKKGMRGEKVKLIQEWLCLHKLFVEIDGDFGSVTKKAVESFQYKNRILVDGIVGDETFGKLTIPMRSALKEIVVRYMEPNRNLMVSYAEQHLLYEPREVGGENKGPWVRLYTGGKEGNYFPWCAAFTSFIMDQTYLVTPLIKSLSVDFIVKDAVRKNYFYKESEINYNIIKPGSFWVLRKEYGDWTHIGIIVEAFEDYFVSIEGNTNIAGAREGVKVMKKFRGYRNKDFIIMEI